MTLLLVMMLISWLFVANRFKATMADAFSISITRATDGRFEATHSITRLSGFPFHVQLKFYNFSLKHSKAGHTEWKIDSQDALTVTSNLLSNDITITLPQYFRLYHMKTETAETEAFGSQEFQLAFTEAASIHTVLDNESPFPWWIYANRSLKKHEVNLSSLQLNLPKLIMESKAVTEGEPLPPKTMWENITFSTEMSQTASYREQLRFAFDINAFDWQYGLGVAQDEATQPLSIAANLTLNLPSEPDLYEVEPFSAILKDASLRIGDAFSLTASGELDYQEELSLEQGKLDVSLEQWDLLLPILSKLLVHYQPLERYKDTAWYRNRLKRFLSKYVLEEQEKGAARMLLHYDTDSEAWQINQQQLAEVEHQLDNSFGVQNYTAERVRVRKKQPKKAASSTKKVVIKSDDAEEDDEDASSGNSSPYELDRGIKPLRRRR
jgi:hypothetical protein